MKTLVSFAFLFCIGSSYAQNVYVIKADSVKLTNCDSTELILENHTQGVKGFLYNTGNGRTIFKKGVVKINDSLYLIGADTLISHVPSNNFWSLSGNLGVDPATQYLGSRDCSPISFRVCSDEKMRLYSTGNLGINMAGVDNNANYKLQVGGNVLATGSSHLIGNMAITKGIDVAGPTATGIRIDASDYKSFIFQGTTQAAAKNMFVFTDCSGGVGMDVNQTDQSIVSIQSGFKSGNGSNTSVLHINPNYQFSPTSSALVIRGVYYNPILTSLPAGTRHIAMETTSGDVLLATTGSGKVGIANANPQTTLDLNGDARINLKTDGTYLTVNAPGPTNWAKGIIYNISDSDGVSNSFSLKLTGYNYGGSKIMNIAANNADLLQFTNAPTYFQFAPTFEKGIMGQYHADLPISLRVNGNPTPTGIKFYAGNYGSSPIMSIMQNGTVGIGSASPTAQLHTTGTVRFAGLTNDDTQTRVIVSDANGNLYYRNASSLATNGILHSSLAVKGEISAKKLRLVQTGWPDYVFDSSYHLTPIADLEQYINLHKHLPGVASAAEVDQDSLDVGGNQAALLKKIEELTLYVIGQEKKLKMQSDEIRSLREQNKDIISLRQEMEDLKRSIRK